MGAVAADENGHREVDLAFGGSNFASRCQPHGQMAARKAGSASITVPVREPDPDSQRGLACACLADYVLRPTERVPCCDLRLDVANRRGGSQGTLREDERRPWASLHERVSLLRPCKSGSGRHTRSARHLVTGVSSSLVPAHRVAQIPTPRPKERQMTAAEVSRCPLS